MESSANKLYEDLTLRSCTSQNPNFSDLNLAIEGVL